MRHVSHSSWALCPLARYETPDETSETIAYTIQAAAHNRRQVAASSTTVNIADGFMSMFNRLGGAQTVTETVRQTITVGGGAAGAGTNATGAVTVTVTAAASTVTFCPGQAPGAVGGAQSGDAASTTPGGVAAVINTLPVVVASGGVGVTVVAVPADARKTSVVGNAPAVSPPVVAPPVVSPPSTSSLAALPTNQPAASSLAALPTPGGNLPAASSLAPLPSQGGATESSATSLEPLPSSTTAGAAAPIVGAPVSASSLASLPGLASSLSDTLSVPTGNAAAVTPVAAPAGAFGGNAGVIPIPSAAAAADASVTTPAVANGAGAGPTINVSGLTLSSQLNLGKLAQQTATATA